MNEQIPPNEPREPRRLCGRRFALAADSAGEADYVYCGLQYPHTGWHMAMVWFWDNDCTPQEPPPPHREGDGHG
jgi:hypothetical protein